MANLQEHAGCIVVQLGGSTQEYAKMVDSLPDGNTFLKDITDLQGTVRFRSFLFLFTSEPVSYWFDLFIDVDAVRALYERYVLYGL